jgi:hypothetical protein
VDSSDPLDHVLEHMAAKHIGSALVTKHGHLVGIFTATDACRVFCRHLWLLRPPGIGLSSSAECDQGTGRGQLHGVVLNLFPILVGLRRLPLFFDVPEFMGRMVNNAHHFSVDAESGRDGEHRSSRLLLLAAIAAVQQQ